MSDDQRETKPQLIEEITDSRRALTLLQEDRASPVEELRKSLRLLGNVLGTITDVFWMSTCGAKEMLYISPGYEALW